MHQMLLLHILFVTQIQKKNVHNFLQRLTSNKTVKKEKSIK